MSVAKRVARLRAARGESLRDAAARIGVSHTTIARIEKGETPSSSHTTLAKIATGYGVTSEWLITGKGAASPLEQAVVADVAGYVTTIVELAREGVDPSALSMYSPLLRKVAKAQLDVKVLNMAVDLIIQQHRMMAAG
jgi:transcriptional regulator with XRE-family HTH domain